MNKLKRVVVLLSVMLMVFSLVGCGDSKESKTTATSTEASVAKPTVDRGGAEISIPEKVEKILVLAPSITETLIDLGCAEKIIGIDTQTQMYAYEELASDLPAFDMMQPDTEQMAALTPDVIFVSGMTDIAGVDIYADIKEMGICVINIPSAASLEGIREDISFIAACVDKVDEANTIITEFNAEIEEISAIGETITDKKTVYFEIAAAPYAYSFGSDTFLNEMIELIGAENVFADQSGWLSVETESAVAANPDVILTSVNYLDDAVAELLAREGWENVNAITNQEVYYIDTQSSGLPNENIVKAFKEMAEYVYPEAYEY